jgi:hypothetical protein
MTHDPNVMTGKYTAAEQMTGVELASNHTRKFLEFSPQLCKNGHTFAHSACKPFVFKVDFR